MLRFVSQLVKAGECRNTDIWDLQRRSRKRPTQKERKWLIHVVSFDRDVAVVTANRQIRYTKVKDADLALYYRRVQMKFSFVVWTKCIFTACNCMTTLLTICVYPQTKWDWCKTYSHLVSARLCLHIASTLYYQWLKPNASC